MIARLAVIISLGALGGCATPIRDINREPGLTPVGTGVRAETVSIPTEPPAPAFVPGNSFWRDSGADLFRDARARQIGDVVTVKISIKDKASIDNSSNRSRDSKMNFNPSLKWGVDTGTLKSSGDNSVNGAVDSSTSAQGKGGISRSESIELLVAAIVTGVLPNGNLLISGSQEVRVNFEVRELSVAGLVRPRDIATDNTVSYDKIAEARISYGGRGRITEIQQPGLGQQILDIIAPF